MRSIRRWPLFVALVAAACSTPPLVGEYEGSHHPPGTAKPTAETAWVPAKLELLADGTCWWHPASEVGPGPHNILTLLGTWHLDAKSSGAQVLTVVPDKRDPARSLEFDVATTAGETVLVAADGSRLTRAR